MKAKLSPYTIASNCTDLTDIRDGINEIQDEMKRLVSFLHRRGNSYNGCTPLPALPDRAIFSERKESHKECSPEQRQIHHRFL